MNSHARLVIEGRRNWVRTHHIGDAQLVTIGRGPENAIDTQDPHTSTKHAEIFVKDGHHFIRDVGSRNGTVVNGKKIEGEERLRNSAAIVVGQTTMSFLTDEEPTIRTMAVAAPKPRGLAVPESALDAVDNAIEKLKKPSLAAGVDPNVALRSALESLQKELRAARTEVRRLRVANEFTLALAMKASPYEKLDRAMTFMAERLNAENGFIIQVDPVDRKLAVRASHGAIRDWHTGEGGSERPPLSVTLVEEAIGSGGKGLHSPSALQDERFANAESVRLLGIRSCLCLPILDRHGSPGGACYLDRRESDKPFDDEDRGAFAAMLEQLSHLLYPGA